MAKQKFDYSLFLNEWYELYVNKKYSVGQIAKMYNLSSGTVAKYLRNVTEIRQERNKPPSEKTITEWADLYEAGLSLTVIAKKYKSRRNTISKHLKEKGIVIKSDIEQSRLYEVNEDYFNEIDTFEKAYWLGFIAADGNIRVTRKNKRLDITLQMEDKDLLEKFLKALSADYPIAERKINGKKYARVTINSTPMCSRLVDLGITEKKTFSLKFPLLEDDEMNRAYILGFFDGDGSVTAEGKNFSITGIKRHLEQIQEFLVEKINLNRTNISSDKRSKAHNLQYGGTINLIKIREWLYSDNPTYCLERKKKKFFELKEAYKTEYVDFVCPICETEFTRLKCQTHLGRVSVYGVTCCGTKCAYKFQSIKRHKSETPEFLEAIKNNVIRAYEDVVYDRKYKIQ